MVCEHDRVGISSFRIPFVKSHFKNLTWVGLKVLSLFKFFFPRIKIEIKNLKCAIGAEIFFHVNRDVNAECVQKELEKRRMPHFRGYF